MIRVERGELSVVVRQTGLNKFHADVAHEIMTEAGYEPAEDVEIGRAHV